MKVVSFYRFLDLESPPAFRDELLAQCEQQGLLGTILVAPEGFNGSISGDEAAMRSVLGWIETRLELDEPIEGRWNDVSEAPFRRMRVRLKKEIVALVSSCGGGSADINTDRHCIYRNSTVR